MRTLLRRRRPDGVIEIRPPRIRDVVLAPGMGLLVMLFFACLLFLVALVDALVKFPYTLWLTGVFLALGTWGVREERSLRVAEAPAKPSAPPRGAA